MPARIDQHQVEQFERDGYLLFRQPVFSDAAFIALKAFADSCYTEADGLDDGKPVQLIDCPHWVHPALFEWIFSDKLIGLVEPIIGPDIALMIDYNQSLNVAEAIRRIERLAEYDLHWVEEPVPAEDLAGHAQVRAQSSVPS